MSGLRTILAPSTVEQARCALRSVLEALVEKMRPEEIWLFGSRAEGRAHEGSDWDLLVVVPDGVDPGLLDPVAAWGLLRGLNVPVDVVPCTRSVFEEEKFELDTLPRAAWTKGSKLYVRQS
ncbi:MAG: nucleotidyltransferase domain-containing protein [Planctomycetota bacterium]